jgi:tetratricopeptide (TPR) repeat protein
MPAFSRSRFALLAALAAGAVSMSPATMAQTAAPAAPGASDATVPANSGMDAPLFYQLLIGEMELRSGEPGTAYEIILDAARRTRDDALFRRAVDIALQGRALDQALTATRSWRLALPESLDALRLQIQILAAGGRLDDLGEPLRALLRTTPAAERNDLITALPRFLQRNAEPKKIASLLTDVLKPAAEAKETAVVARVATGRAWLNAGEPDIALALARDAQSLDPAAPAPAFLALELMGTLPAAESIVRQQIERPDAPAALRLSYVRVLTSSQRYGEAARQLEVVTREQPADAPAFLTLGVLYQELKQNKEAETALLKYVELASAGKPAAVTPPPPTSPATAAGATGATGAQAAGDDDDDEASAKPERGLVQAWLSLAQLAEQRADYKAAETWLAKVDDPQRALDVQSRRASILARQGKLAQARELIRKSPEKSTDDARAKFIAEAALLRDVKRWKDAYDVLASANRRFADDADLLYEQAMMAEKTDKLEDMEKLLRRVIVLKPDSPHAHNALGYSLADRGMRLTEARALIARALELSPGDPFITDSLGWVEFKLGRREEALKLLRGAYAARPDTEIGAHLGEVLWAMGQKDEARRVWREARSRDAGNEVLRETLARLRADP